MDLPRARGTTKKRATVEARRSTSSHGRLTGLAGRAATELERLRPAGRRAQRSRADRVVDRIKHLV